MNTFKELLEGKGLNNPGVRFKNTMKLHYGDIEKFTGKGSGFSVYKDGGVWTISDNQDKHVATYNLKEGELYTDLKVNQIETMIKRGK